MPGGAGATTMFHMTSCSSRRETAPSAPGSRSKIAVLDSQLADTTRTSPVAALLASGDKLYERWEAMSPTEQAQAIDEIAVVTIKPCPAGLRRFDRSQKLRRADCAGPARIVFSTPE